jgi:tRNA (cmo5U34)-methyltransferase
MATASNKFENRYLSGEFVDLWKSDSGMEAVRSFWRQKIVSFLPLENSTTIQVLDLGAGTGALSLDILNRFPNASVTLVDFSEAMLTHAREQLSKFNERVTIVQANLGVPSWSQSIRGQFDVVVSSFVTHTMPNEARQLYAELYRLVKNGGYFLSCDIFSAPGATLDGLYHRITLEDLQARIKRQTDKLKSLEEIHKLQHERREKYRGFFKDDDAAPVSRLNATVVDHLGWLKEAGFDEVDCLMKYRYNAVIGGFRH